ncbi:MAG: STAS/SEC14 domain-containing protein [Candidatus Omnitrophica bacterium]|nr:STAS/SEC14 domain-containing protein [Candidatus Omnitrophota bacterium]
MDYKIAFSEGQNSFIVKTSGKMEPDSYIKMAQDLLSHPRHKTGGNLVLDHEDLDFSCVADGDLQKIRCFHEENEDKIGCGKSAIVVRPGMAKHWYKLWSRGEKIRTANNVRVFEDINEAINWIML